MPADPHPTRRRPASGPRRLLRAAALALSALAAAAQPGAAQTLIRDAEIESTLRRLADPVFRAASLPPDSIEILLVADSQPNAFVFGGRNMVFTTGLLTRFADPEKIRGVMAHEAGHITGGHLARRQIAMDNLRGPALASAVLGVVAAAAAGAAGGGAGAGAAVALGSQSAVQRAMLAFNRAEESAADQAALTYLERAGVDPEGMREVLETFRGQEVFSDRYRDPYALTHPISQARLSAIERRAAESPHAGTEPDAGIVYWTRRMKAKLEAFLNPPSATLSRLDPDAEDELATLRRAVALHRAPDPPAALREVERLVSLRPQDPYYHELKGQILLEGGRAEAAVAPLRRAAELAPREPLILGYLGRALLARGTPEADAEARDVLARASREAQGTDPGILRDLAIARSRAGEDGLSALASAERLMLLGRATDARRLAERAKGLLPRGGPAWLRADDILASTRPDAD